MHLHVTALTVYFSSHPVILWAIPVSILLLAAVKLYNRLTSYSDRYNNYTYFG